MTIMFSRDHWRRLADSALFEWTLFGFGVLLMALSPVVGILPGPGGVFLFAIGFALVLKTSMWAKRHYVRFKRKQPKAGRWIDWGLRRNSLRRREPAALRQRASAKGNQRGG